MLCIVTITMIAHNISYIFSPFFLCSFSHLNCSPPIHTVSTFLLHGCILFDLLSYFINRLLKRFFIFLFGGSYNFVFLNLIFHRNFILSYLFFLLDLFFLIAVITFTLKQVGKILHRWVKITNVTLHYII